MVHEELGSRRGRHDRGTSGTWAGTAARWYRTAQPSNQRPPARVPRIIAGMLLAIDIGNSNVTTGLFKAGALRSTRRAATISHATPDEVEILLDELLRLDDASFADVDAIALASVVPVLTASIEAVAARRERPLTVAGAGSVPLPI